MDTKLKRSKKIISFIAWLFAVSILAVNLIQISIECYRYGGRQYIQNVQEALSGDYQNTAEFRIYISGLLNDFISMSVDEAIDYCAEYGYYDNYEKAASYYFSDSAAEYSVDAERATTILAEELPSEEIAVTEDAYSYEEMPEDKSGEHVYIPAEQSTNKEKNRIIAEQYHNDIKNDRNILYTVENNGKVMYTNDETFGFPKDASALPEGYNFLLTFDGNKATIIKDGKEINIYGDGYYGKEGDWYIPGYKNFPADEAIGQSRIYIAVAKKPSFIIDRNSGNNSYHNILSSMEDNLQNTEASVRGYVYTTAAAVILYFIAFALRKNKKEANIAIAGFTGKLWYEIKLLLLFICLGFLISILLLINASTYYLNEYGWYMETMGINPIIIFAYAAVTILVLIVWMFLNDARYNKTVWKKSIVGCLYNNFNTKLMSLPVSKRMIRRYRVVFLAQAAVSVIAVSAAFLMLSDYGDEGFVLACIIGLLLILCIIAQARFIRNNKNTAHDLELLVNRIDEVRTGGVFKENLAEEIEIADSDLGEALHNLNDIQSGMNTALEEQMKSERMKVELIANVSHDIKTPLTSIISYVELMKQEDNLPEHVREYVSILDNKSQRLKTMVQDVFEVSKAASGELPVHMENLDLGKLMRQTLADMEEQITAGDVIIKQEIPDNEIMIHADGTRLYRVFQNLILNAVKYSLEGSRVYITLQSDGTAAVACVKNISREEIAGDTNYAERFTRGDKSRSDGGSGLGLSIAQSFTEACGGSFKIETIADLFVVTISFDVVSGQNNKEANETIERKDSI